MVSNKELKKRLEVRRKDTKAQDIILEPTESANGDSNLVCPDCGTVNLSISNFCSECGNPIELKPPGYVVCDVCYGIYELEEGESPEDFVNSQCQCGGNLTYIQDIDELEGLKKNCPICGQVNPYHVKKCEKCSRFFDIGEYFESLLYDIEITHNVLRIYQKANKEITDIYQHDREKIDNPKIVKDRIRSRLYFNYNNEEVIIDISSEQASKLRNSFEIPEKRVICPSHKCKNILLIEGEKCPVCGKTSQTVGMNRYNNLEYLKKTAERKRVNKQNFGLGCLNVACEFTGNLNKDQTCPKCGSMAGKVGSWERAEILNKKKKIKKERLKQEHDARIKDRNIKEGLLQTVKGN
ncbi:MAG: hypothetical protein A4E25_00867 [Methanobacterium sp. PtaB.Bin024]|nr:MAG: hypothetical protein A4E25_00867 [Methanobacterium sp. PtaB.Bin024]